MTVLLDLAPQSANSRDRVMRGVLSSVMVGTRIDGVELGAECVHTVQVRLEF